MNKTIKAVALGLSLLLVGVCYAQDFNKGFNALVSQDYATALRELRPLADQGNASAQFLLGGMYDEGNGVIQDYKETVKWYRMAADQGDASARGHAVAATRSCRGTVRSRTYVLQRICINFCCLIAY